MNFCLTLETDSELANCSNDSPRVLQRVHNLFLAATFYLSLSGKQTNSTISPKHFHKIATKNNLFSSRRARAADIWPITNIEIEMNYKNAKVSENGFKMSLRPLVMKIRSIVRRDFWARRYNFANVQPHPLKYAPICLHII